MAMYGVFDKAGEQLKKGRFEMEFESIFEAKCFRARYVERVDGRRESDYDVLNLDTMETVA